MRMGTGAAAIAHRRQPRAVNGVSSQVRSAIRRHPLPRGEPERRAPHDAREARLCHGSRPRCSRDLAEISPRCSRGLAEV